MDGLAGALEASDRQDLPQVTRCNLRLDRALSILDASPLPPPIHVGLDDTRVHHKQCDDSSSQVDAEVIEQHVLRSIRTAVGVLLGSCFPSKKYRPPVKLSPIEHMRKGHNDDKGEIVQFDIREQRLG